MKSTIQASLVQLIIDGKDVDLKPLGSTGQFYPLSGSDRQFKMRSTRRFKGIPGNGARFLASRGCQERTGILGGLMPAW
ncbi:MAG: hypothetical protein ACTSUE_23750 [Promethearchaeota archaeon]